MKRKRFEKLLMSRGIPCKTSRRITEKMKHTYHMMEKHTCFVLDDTQDNRLYSDGSKEAVLKFKPYKILSYADTFRELVERGRIYV